MRLLHTESFELQEFEGSKIPPYAILSHTWETEEVTYRDMQDEVRRERMNDWQKIKKVCLLARSRSHTYIWIDTCCIDKSSSAELTEAINSMFRWYRRAAECYAYLCDLDVDEDECFREHGRSQFQRSRWFTRGWTLQELIAPKIVTFWNSRWQFWWDKKTLQHGIYETTGINDDVYGDHWSGTPRVHQKSVAQRMSFASGRETTREEDITYCLLGLFDIEMLLLYGEGLKAFFRLHLEILRRSDDESIFAWMPSSPFFDDGLQGNFKAQRPCRGLLAHAPENFKHSGNVVQFRIFDRPPYQITNKGLRISLALESLSAYTPEYFQNTPLNPTLYRAMLNCGVEDAKRNSLPVVIFLLQPAGNLSVYHRIGPIEGGGQPDITNEHRTIFVPQDYALQYYQSDRLIKSRSKLAKVVLGHQKEAVKLH